MGPTNPFVCTECDARFPRYKPLMIHKKTHFSGKGNAGVEQSVDLTKFLKNYASLNNGCSVREALDDFLKSPEYASSYGSHANKDVDCDGSENEENDGDSSNNGDDDDGEIIKCDACYKIFSTRGNLYKHMRLIHNIDTKMKRGRMKSVRYVSTTVKPHQCDICRLNFLSERHMLKHKARAHVDKQHKCDQCSKSYTLRSNLTRHIRLAHKMLIDETDDSSNSGDDESDDKEGDMASVGESGEKEEGAKKDGSGDGPYKCNQCNRSYTWECNLKRHLKNDHASAQTKKYLCGECDKTYTSRDSLYRHMKWKH